MKVPVIAAGGIADANGVRGRDGARRGRRAGRDGLHALSRSHDERRASRGAGERGGRATALTNLFTGRPGARHREPPHARARADQAAVPAFPLAAAAIAPLRAKAESQGSGDFSPLWAGQNTSGCKEVSAAELTHALASAK